MKRPFILGIITFLIFALFLEQILHFFVLRFFSVSSDLRIYAVYAAVSASLFEESGRFLIMRHLYKKHDCKFSGLIYGCGYGCFESFVIGLSMIENIVISISLNLGFLDIQNLEIAERFSFLFETSSLIYLLSAYERVITILLQIFLSIIMWKGINLQKRIIVSSVFFIHFIFDFICIILNNYFGILSTEIFITVFVLLFGLYSFKIYRRS